MIQRYMRLWPDNPFTFRIPYQLFPSTLKKKYQDKVEFIKTVSNIKHTLLKLIEDLNDDEWIYWCMDDRYPTYLKVDEISYIYDWIITMHPKNLSGVMFSNFPKMMHVKNIMSGKNSIYDYRGKKYYRRKSYAMIWMHQFLRVKVIKDLFNKFPDEIKYAKQMDYFKENMVLPDEYKLYVYSKNTAEYGESTHRGKITLNCVNSFKQLGMVIPSDFERGDKQIIIRQKNTISTHIKYKLQQLYKKFQSPIINIIK